jgi:uncharacterized protein (UPF0264 family)
MLYLNLVFVQTHISALKVPLSLSISYREVKYDPKVTCCGLGAAKALTALIPMRAPNTAKVADSRKFLTGLQV